MPPASNSRAKKSSVANTRSVVPILSTITHIKGYPDKLVIFQIPASPYWWMRYYDGKHIKRSTKTQDKSEAIKTAKAFYEELVVNKKLGISNNTRMTSFELCANAILEEDEQKRKRGELSDPYVKSQKNIINKHIKTFFKRFEVGAIDYTLLDSFKTYLHEKKLAPASIKSHFVFVKKILDYAQRHAIIPNSPLMPKTKNADNPRGYFTLEEYKLLRRTARRLVGTAGEVLQKMGEGDDAPVKKLRNIHITREIQLLIPFMVYTFIRPTDVKNLQHKHVEIKSGEEGEYLWMPLPPSKRHSKPMTSMPWATYYYKKIRQLRLEKLGNPKANIGSDFVFAAEHPVKRAYGYTTLYRQFELILQRANLKYSDAGDVRTLYSLRHTSLMYRLMYGGEINPLKLANNARTSVEMLERFYLAQLESSDYTKDLHKKKSPKRSKKESAIIYKQPEADHSAQLQRIANDKKPSPAIVSDSRGRLKLKK